MVSQLNWRKPLAGLCDRVRVNCIFLKLLKMIFRFVFRIQTRKNGVQKGFFATFVSPKNIGL